MALKCNRMDAFRSWFDHRELRLAIRSEFEKKHGDQKRPESQIKRFKPTRYTVKIGAAFQLMNR